MPLHSPDPPTQCGSPDPLSPFVTVFVLIVLVYLLRFREGRDSLLGLRSALRGQNVPDQGRVYWPGACLHFVVIAMLVMQFLPGPNSAVFDNKPDVERAWYGPNPESSWAAKLWSGVDSGRNHFFALRYGAVYGGVAGVVLLVGSWALAYSRYDLKDLGKWLRFPIVFTIFGIAGAIYPWNRWWAVDDAGWSYTARNIVAHGPVAAALSALGPLLLLQRWSVMIHSRVIVVMLVCVALMFFILRLLTSSMCWFLWEWSVAAFLVEVVSVVAAFTIRTKLSGDYVQQGVIASAFVFVACVIAESALLKRNCGSVDVFSPYAVPAMFFYLSFWLYFLALAPALHNGQMEVQEDRTDMEQELAMDYVPVVPPLGAGAGAAGAGHGGEPVGEEEVHMDE